MAILYDASGTVIFPAAPAGSYLTNISLRHTSADAAGSVVWAIHNPAASTKTAYIKRVRGILSFDGSAAAATGIGYEIIKFSGADPTTGTTIDIVKKRNAYPASQIAAANIQQKSGILTMSGITNIQILAVLRLPVAVTNPFLFFDLGFVISGIGYEALEIAVDYGLAIRVGPVAAIIGQTLSGQVVWDER